MRYSNPQLQRIVARLRELQRNPAMAVGSGPMLIPELLQQLPAQVSAEATRADYTRGISYSLPLVFEDVLPGEVTTSQSIRLTVGDFWVRGMTAQAYPDFRFETVEQQQGVSAAIGLGYKRFISENLRGAFDFNFDLDDRQGFVTDGDSEVFTSGAASVGIGARPTPVDWRLQRSQTIRGTLRNRIEASLPAEIATVVPRLKYVVICFHGLLLNTNLGP